MSGYGAKAYKQTSVATASRGQVLIMLYEGAIQNIKKAIVCIEMKDLSGKGKYIIKTHDIINELNTSLNFELGGKVAEDLQRLYNFMTDQLLKANMESSKEKLQTVQKLMETLLEGWRVAVSKFQKNGTSLK